MNVIPQTCPEISGARACQHPSGLQSYFFVAARSSWHPASVRFVSIFRHDAWLLAEGSGFSYRGSVSVCTAAITAWLDFLRSKRFPDVKLEVSLKRNGINVLAV